MPRGVYVRTEAIRRAISRAKTGQRVGPNVSKFWRKVDSSGGPNACWLWTGCANARGYGQTSLNGKPCLAHRKAYSLHNERDPGELLVCHTCDTPRCCNPAHLFLGSNADNMADMASKGRARCSTLTAGQVEGMLARIANGERPSVVCDEAGVHRSAIYYWMGRLGLNLRRSAVKGGRP